MHFPPKLLKYFFNLYEYLVEIPNFKQFFCSFLPYFQLQAIQNEWCHLNIKILYSHKNTKKLHRCLTKKPVVVALSLRRRYPTTTYTKLYVVAGIYLPVTLWSLVGRSLPMLVIIPTLPEQDRTSWHRAKWLRVSLHWNPGSARSIMTSSSNNIRHLTNTYL